MNRNWVYSLFALWIVCSFACMQPKPVANVEVQKENFVFSIKGTDTLSLDKYELTSMSPASKKPVMICTISLSVEQLLVVCFLVVLVLL